VVSLQPFNIINPPNIYNCDVGGESSFQLTCWLNQTGKESS